MKCLPVIDLHMHSSKAYTSAHLCQLMLRMSNFPLEILNGENKAITFRVYSLNLVVIILIIRDKGTVQHSLR